MWVVFPCVWGLLSLHAPLIYVCGFESAITFFFSGTVYLLVALYFVSFPLGVVVILRFELGSGVM